MVRLLLSIRADLENVTDLIPSDDFEYFFRVKCTNCQEQHPKLISMNRTEEYPVSGSKGNKAHFVLRCGNCKREGSAKFDQNSLQSYKQSANGQFAPLVALDCRGLEFTDFEPKGHWRCVGNGSGTVFDEIELQECEWTEYDEKALLPVSIMGVDSKWAKA